MSADAMSNLKGAIDAAFSAATEVSTEVSKKELDQPKLSELGVNIETIIRQLGDNVPELTRQLQVLGRHLSILKTRPEAPPLEIQHINALFTKIVTLTFVKKSQVEELERAQKKFNEVFAEGTSDAMKFTDQGYIDRLSAAEDAVTVAKQTLKQTEAEEKVAHAPEPAAPPRAAPAAGEADQKMTISIAGYHQPARAWSPDERQPPSAARTPVKPSQAEVTFEVEEMEEAETQEQSGKKLLEEAKKVLADVIETARNIKVPLDEATSKKIDVLTAQLNSLKDRLKKEGIPEILTTISSSLNQFKGPLDEEGVADIQERLFKFLLTAGNKGIEVNFD